MSLSAFQLISIGMVVASIVLIILVIFIVRSLRQKRRESSAETDLPAAPPSPQRAGIGRRKLSPEPAPDPAPPQPRRRQLSSFAEDERAASGEAEPTLPVAPPPEPEPVFEPQPVPEAEPLLAPEPEPASYRSMAQPQARDFEAEVMQRLEDAFEALQTGEITLDAYRRQLMEEEASIALRIASLEPAGDGPDLEAALTARESVLWCLDWADEQARGGQSGQ